MTATPRHADTMQPVFCLPANLAEELQRFIDQYGWGDVTLHVKDHHVQQLTVKRTIKAITTNQDSATLSTSE